MSENIFKQIPVGRRFSPLLYSISEEIIFKYVNAVDDLNFFHRDSTKAYSSPFGGIIAPPTIASLFVLKAYRTDWTPPPGGIHLKQKFRFYGPIRPGDLLTVQAELTKKVEKAGHWFLTFISHSRNQRGELVVWSESTSMWKNIEKKVKKSQTSKMTSSKSQPLTISNISISNTKGWKIGESLPSLTKKITREKINQYEEILGIGNPLHVDEEYARSTPFGGIIAHGLMSAAYISESLMMVFPWEWVHHGEMDIQFLHPLRPEDTIQTKGELKEKESKGKEVILIFGITCKNQWEEKILKGTATIPIFNK